MASSSFENKPLPGEDQSDDFVAAMRIMQSGGLPMVLKTTAELDVFNVLAKADHELSAKEIVDQLPMIRNPDAHMGLDRMLRLLATHSIIRCSVGPDGCGRVTRRYGLTPLSKLFSTDETGHSLIPYICLVEDSVARAPWNKLKDALVDGGIPFNMVYGVNGFSYGATDPRFNEVFNNAMFGYTTIIIKKMLESYKGFDGIKQLVDVGGNLGHILQAITSKYPEIKGINFDQPHVIAHAPPYPGVEHVGGNMFESVPKGNAIFMKGILHDWNDDHCLKLLKNCYEALPDDGKMIVMDLVLSEEPDTTIYGKVTSLMDIWLMNIGGRERTDQELLALAKAAGFTSIKLVCRVHQFWMMEIYK